MNRLFILSLMLGMAACKNAEEKTKAAAATSKEYHILREEGMACLTATPDVPLSKEAMASAEVAPGPCPATLSIDGFKSTAMRVCSPYRIEEDKASYAWTVYDQTKADGTGQARTAEEAELICTEGRI